MLQPCRAHGRSAKTRDAVLQQGRGWPLASNICTICRHPKKHLIEVGLTYGTPLRVLAKRFEVSFWAVHRHGRNHLSPQLRAAILVAQKPSEVDLEQLQRSEAEGLLGQLVSQRARLQRHSELAFEVGNLGDAVRTENAITANLALVGKLLGTLVTHHEVTHRSVLISADYLQLRETLLTALRPYPEAAKAVSVALHALETRAAEDIKARAAEGKRPLLIEHDAEVLQ
jgi:hypothetical protein